MSDSGSQSCFDVELTQIRVVDPRIRDAIVSHQHEEVGGTSLRRAVEALCDLGVARLAAGDIRQAIERTEAALKLDPSNQHAFHNMAAILLAHGLLRGKALNEMQGHLLRHWSKLPWARSYASVMYAPRFLNLEFVSGKCNLSCRMCVGGHGKTEPGRLRYMSCEDFDEMLRAVPTIAGLTVSSGDSEPLLHPELERIIEIAARHHVSLDIYTNGHPLNARKARTIVQSGAIGMMNFSLDAATPETYRRIRGEDFHRVIQKIQMLQSMKQEVHAQLPLISFSFVAMADNIAELPVFVDLAVQIGANRVYVEELIGWTGADSVNRPATDHPQCREITQEAVARAGRAGLRLDLPERLLFEHKGETTDSGSPPGGSTGSPAASYQLQCCGWLNGVWVQQDGRLDPCCLVHGVADLGCVKDGSILRNAKYTCVKDLLAEGKVFAECVDQRACQYVQQQMVAGIPFRVITAAEAGRPEGSSGESAEAPVKPADDAADLVQALVGAARGA